MASFSPQELGKLLGDGLLAFPITPFDAELEIDRNGFREHLSWMEPHAPAGVFAACGTGEFFSLSLGEVVGIVGQAVEGVGGKIPVVAGVGYGRSLAIELATGAERAGADGILLFPPYLVASSQAGLAAHVEAVCKSTSLGVILYNRDNAVVQADTLARLCERCPNLIGLKDGVGDIELMVRIETRIGDRLVYFGGLPTAETFALPYLTMGVTTYSSALFNFMPNFARSFYKAVRRGDAATIKKGLREFVLPYTAIRDRGRGYAVSIVKAGAAIVGRPAGDVRPPLTRLDQQSWDDLAALIASVGDKDIKADSAESPASQALLERA